MTGSRRAVAIATGALAVLLLGAGVTLTAQSAGALPVPGSAGGNLSLEADSYPALWSGIEPGDSIDWEVWPVLAGRPQADLSLQIDGGGDLASSRDGLQLKLSSCIARWVASACNGGAGTMIVQSPLADIDDTHSYDLGTIDEGSGPYFLATLSIPSSMTISRQQALQGWSGTFAFGFTASGELETITPAGVLASTGLDPLGPILFAAGVLLVGVLLAVSRTRRPR